MSEAAAVQITSYLACAARRGLYRSNVVYSLGNVFLGAFNYFAFLVVNNEFDTLSTSFGLRELLRNFNDEKSLIMLCSSTSPLGGRHGRYLCSKEEGVNGQPDVERNRENAKEFRHYC